jgi:NAD(P)-dependent dehydrogenase (short-subunit alcohol dehydrogenase family)
MAFVQVVSSLPTRTARTTTVAACGRPVMAASGLSRRAALRFAALGVAAAAGLGVARAFDLEELKEDVEELKYDDEVTEVGPDDKEELITRTKKKKPDNKARFVESRFRTFGHTS